LNVKKVLSYFFLFACSYTTFSQTSESAVSLIDARDWSPDESPFPLVGLGHFYDHQLLTPVQIVKTQGAIRNFPELWRDDSNPEAGSGYGTYFVTVALPQSHEKVMALALPQMYSSYRLYVNGKLNAENGIVGNSIDDCKPQWLPQTVSIPTPTDTLTLVLQIANFHHAKGGIKEPIYLGSSSRMNLKRMVAVTSNLTETIVLLVLGLFFLFVYLSQARKKITLYFALFCLTWSIRSVFSNLYLAIAFSPQFDWDTLLRIEYITLYLTMIWAILFLSQLFDFESNLFAKYIFVFCNLLFTVFTLFTSPRVFTQWLDFYLVASAVLLLYAGFTVVRAWVNERVGSGLLTISLILGINIFGYDIFVYEGFSSYDPIIFSLGYIAIFLMVALALSMHISLIKGKSRPTTHLSYDDLYKKDAK
jgi:hypothetical protein